MIEVNGKQFITLDDEMFVNGQKVMRAYANGSQVYPSGGGTLIKFRGESSLSTINSYFKENPYNGPQLGRLTDATVVHSFRGSFVACIRTGYNAKPLFYRDFGTVIQNIDEKRGFEAGTGFYTPTRGGIALPTLGVASEWTEDDEYASKYYWKAMAKAYIGYTHSYPYYQRLGTYNWNFYHCYEFHWEPSSYPPWLNGEVMKIIYPGYSESELTVDKDGVWHQAIYPRAESSMDGSSWSVDLDSVNADGYRLLANGMRVNMSVPVEVMLEYYRVDHDGNGHVTAKTLESSGKFSDSDAGGEIGYMPIKQILYYGDYDTAPEWAKNVYESDL